MMLTRPNSYSRPFGRALMLCGLAAIALAAGSCKTKGGGSYSGGGGGGGGGSSSWLVGTSGTMIRVSHRDPRDLGSYDLGSRPDLFAIACRGDHEAWVTGAAGTILRTFDGGAHWDAIPGGGTAALRSVAVAESGGVYVAGDQGTLLFSADSGQRWAKVSAGAVSFTGVTTTALGDVALLTAADGSLWRYERAADRLTSVVSGGSALHAVSIAADGSRAVAVGDRGLFLASEDGGRTFAARALGTTRALYNVWTSESVDRAIAVGEAGVVVEVAGGAVAHLEEHGGGALRAIHLTSTDGTGLAVGDGGAAWLTGDAGKTWSPVDVETTADLTGVDALFGEPHL